MGLKYTNEVIIQKPIDQVTALFADPSRISEWQPGFISMEQLEGEPAQVGSKVKLRYKMGKREIEMIETITVNNLPREFCGYYEAKGVKNDVNNYFEALNDSSTRYFAESEFHFSGLMKLMGWLMPTAFRKESQKVLDRFKAFCEAQP